MSKRLFYFIQDPYYGGGLKSMNAFIEQFLVKRGVMFSQVFLSAQKALSLNRILSLKLRLNHEVIDKPFRKVFVSSFPYIEPLAFVLPRHFLQKEIKQHDFFFGVTGYATPLYFFKCAGVSYKMWLATTLDSEKKAQPKFTNFRQKVVHFLNSLFIPLSRYQEKQALLGASKIYTLSTQSKKEMVEIGVPEDRIEIMCPPVDTKKFIPPQDEHFREPIMLCVCRLDDPRKNIPLLLDAYALIKNDCPEYRLVLAGPYDKTVVDMVAERQLESSVELIGLQTQEQLVLLYQKAAFFVLSSRQEGFGIVLAEAMAAGLPVISTKSGGPEDVVVDGQTGYLVDHEINSLAEKMKALATDASKRELFGKNSLERVRSLYSYDAVEAQLEDIFADVLPS
ncbi:glycosyltransferase [candidate division WWE3 bacterium]|nr:glycosyltransferase [candidate division WWE3 bacterium]